MLFLARSSPWRQLFKGKEQESLPGSDDLIQPLNAVLQQFSGHLEDNLVKSWQLDLVKALRRLDLPAWRISQIISDHNAWLYRKALDEALREMKQHGWGDPPLGFCVLLLGSGAREESLLRPDQDNAMILDDYPDSRHQEIDTWFQHLGESFTDKLDRAGIPLCKGHVMARWPLWRKPLHSWITQMQIWTSERIVKRVQLSNILLDFTSVYGDARLEKAFRHELQALLPRSAGFLNEMGDLLNEIPVALDAFDRLVGDDQEAPHSYALNLKRQGLLPLQSAVRLLCLSRGLMQGVSTRERLTQLLAEGEVSAEEASDLLASLEHLQELLLAAQLASLEAGRLADNWIDIRQLTSRQKAVLKQDLKMIRALVKRAQKAVA